MLYAKIPKTCSIVDIFEAIEEVDKSIRLTDATWNAVIADQEAFWKSPRDIFNSFKRPSQSAKEHARSAEILNHFFEKLTADQPKKGENQLKRLSSLRSIDLSSCLDNLSHEVIDRLEELAGCKSNFVLEQDCHASENQYRTITGQCNNLNNPFWGSTNQPLHRYAAPAYEDGISQPIGWNNIEINGFQLPNVRSVSNQVFSQLNSEANNDEFLSHFAVVFGQYIDHDFSLSPLTPSNAEFFNANNCQSMCDNTLPCFPIQLEESDSKFEAGQTECLTFVRSAATCGSDEVSQTLSNPKDRLVRKQINIVSSLVDASTVYGPNQDRALSLRSLDGSGRMRVNDVHTDNGRDLMPEDPNTPCVQKDGQTKVNCFLAGDIRASEHLTLASVHTLWLRLHNQIADELQSLNPHWGEEELYQETRHIIAALHQKTFYDEYYNAITNDNLPEYTGYKPSTNPNIAAAFSGAAFRFGHVTIQPIVLRLGEDWNEHPDFGNHLLHTAFFSPWKIVDEGGLDPLVRGLAGNFAKLPDGMNEELRQHLFKLANTIGFDLASLNIQRGRDHGIPLYSTWLDTCGFDQVNSFDDLEEVIPNAQLRNTLEELYGHPGNMDLFVAGLVEKRLGLSCLQG